MIIELTNSWIKFLKKWNSKTYKLRSIIMKFNEKKPKTLPSGYDEILNFLTLSLAANVA